MSSLTTEARRHGEKLPEINCGRIIRVYFEGSQKQKLATEDAEEKRRSQEKINSKIEIHKVITATTKT